MTTSGEGWAAAGVASGGSVASATGPRPGLEPVLEAALRSLVVDGFRIGAFVLGATILGSLIAGIGLLGLVAGSFDTLAQLRTDAPGYVARTLALLPLQAGVYAAMVAAVVAYLGIRMTARMLAVSSIPERTIRRRVALVGAVVLAGLTWFVLPMRLTPVLAIVATMLPLVFAVAVLRGPRHPPIAKGVRPYLALAGVLAVGTIAGMGFVLSASPVAADPATFGVPASAAGLHVDGEWWRQWVAGEGRQVVGHTHIEVEPADQGHIASLRTEVHAAKVRDDRLLLGELMVVSAPTGRTDGWDRPAWTMPAPTAPRLVAIFSIATLTDGREVILDPEPSIRVTPEWEGRLHDYWLGG